MSTDLLTEDQREALQELVNIGMGQAGASIAQVLDEFVKLSIPRISSVAAANLSQEIVRLVGDADVSAIRQAFTTEFRGEAIVIYPEQSMAGLHEVMGYDADTKENKGEILLDIGNILVGACVGGIANLLGMLSAFSAPTLIADQTPAYRLLKPEHIQARVALLVEVYFVLEERDFRCHLIILMPETDILALGQALDRFVDGI
ncbi:hypothetical protein [Amantichitinum ursilacus]|uniref:CheY-P phosphatase CheC n=1 Tax=Amantichitinum ursilacus TaxID=857265 RepID=A0A0N0XL31_9NEIS|nr:hypothetical protein [Amantichitinum ursilacus]KPC55184.1 CheY-P phosphatase CheC [Amantichitinum ursilacus]